MLCDIGTNLLSDLIYSLLVFGFFYVIFQLTKRRKLLKFFGIEKTKKLTIFTSNLIVEKYGSLGNDGFRYSFQGTAIPNEESKSSAQLQSVFNYFLPSQLEKQGFVSKLLISDVDVKVFPSPIENNMVEQNATLISLGFPPYNLISRFIENSLNPSARLDYITTELDLNKKAESNNFHSNPRLIPSDNSAGTAVPSGYSTSFPPYVPSGVTGIKYDSVSSGGHSASTIQLTENDDEQPPQPVIKVKDFPPITDTSFGFIQKIIDNQNKRFIFYIAGLSENSTAGSANYLAGHWEDLNKIYGSNDSFCVLLKVSNTNNRISQIIHKS